MLYLICPLIKDWVNNGEAGDLRRHRAHYDDIVMHCFGEMTAQPAIEYCHVQVVDFYSLSKNIMYIIIYMFHSGFTCSLKANVFGVNSLELEQMYVFFNAGEAILDDTG